uniref:Uncharacterized protein n=1 Tax=Rhizophora mucronata TaxID=61149 RepID=A0A2P2QIN4_RHIMU
MYDIAITAMACQILVFNSLWV